MTRVRGLQPLTWAVCLRGIIPALLLMSACEGGHFKSTAVSDSVPFSEPESENQEVADNALPTETADGATVDTVGKAPTDDGLIFKDCNGNADLPFIADLYQLPVDTKQLPDFASLKPIKQICIRQLNIANRDFTEGFPGVEGLIEWFALSIKVKLIVPKDGDYVLSVNSDDGSKLFLNDELVLDNDGLHSNKEVAVTKTLTAGVYDARIDYYQGPRFHIALELFWQEPGAAAKSYIPAIYLKRP